MTFQLTAEEVEELLYNPTKKFLSEIRKRVLESSESDENKAMLLERLQKIHPEKMQ